MAREEDVFVRAANFVHVADEDLVLASPADAMLVQKFVADPPRAAPSECRRQNRFVFRECLLGRKWARHVQIAVRPAALGAEAADVIDDLSDLLVGQLITEGRHHRIECANRAALMDDRIPIEVRLGRGQAAVGEIGRVGFESADGDRLPATVGSVARRARGFIQLLSAEARRDWKAAHRRARQEIETRAPRRPRPLREGNTRDRCARNLRTVLKIFADLRSLRGSSCSSHSRAFAMSSCTS